VVVGGYDVANFPELKYGSLSSPFRKKLTLFTFKHVSLSLSVVEELEKKIRQICATANTTTIYTGYEFKSTDEQPDFKREREKYILTVSITDNWQRVQIKGIDRFKDLAEILPEFQFYIIGVTENARDLFDPIPTNLVLLPPLNQSELSGYYKKASFYAQFSRSEGLPNALCEGMLYGCIPIGTRIGGIPAAIGNQGLIMDEWDAQIAADFITRNHNKVPRENISLRIKEKFDLNLRRVRFLKEMDRI
jgi:glycosyltransferase involved in cell wall biosynthesis